jgi:hypothetical protein
VTVNIGAARFAAAPDLPFDYPDPSSTDGRRSLVFFPP